MVDCAVVNPLADYSHDIDTMKLCRYQATTPFAPLIVETFGMWGTSTPPVIAQLSKIIDK
jgi:hypothetical protein